MGDVRNRLDRKSELRLYEWIKNGENYSKLSDKTVMQGAATVSDELGMNVSGSVLVGLVQAMGLEPFWRQRLNGHAKQRMLQLDEDTFGILQGIHEKVKLLGKRMEHHEKALGQLRQVCENLVSRLELVEKSR